MGISAHGARITRNGEAITELRDITLPTMSRDDVEVTRWSDEDERRKIGIKRVGTLSFDVNWLASDLTHVGLMDAWVSASEDEYETTLADGSTMLFSGFVVNIAPMAPVDGPQSARVTIRPASNLAFAPMRVTEDGNPRITESGATRVTG